jgi:FKBP-type peptidyl-prolyl cis-trans isomerase SlyD
MGKLIITPMVDFFGVDRYSTNPRTNFKVRAAGLQPDIFFKEKMTMKIQNDAYVAIDYTLTLDSKEVVDCSEPGKPFGFIFGGGQVIIGLEKGLEGMEQGQSVKFTVEPEEGYGQPRQELFRELPREHFPGDVDLEPNMIFEGSGPQGTFRFRVESVNDEMVVADLNHPLAGQRLHFEVEVVEVREARAEELEALKQHAGCAPESCACCDTTCD